MDNKIYYDIRWSNNVDEKFIDDFNIVKMSVFGGNNNRNTFKKLYLDNIYGPSIVVVVYINGKPCAARALWRNDIDGIPAYQPSGTCVIDEYRGLGIFTKMTTHSIEMLDKDAIIYNYPNNNSYPGYIKMGWELKHSYKYWNVLISLQSYINEHPIDMDISYAKWFSSFKNDIYYINYFYNYFLVKEHPTKPLLYIVSKVEKSVSQFFPKSKNGILLFQSEKKLLLGKRKSILNIVYKNKNINNIPIWKWDAI